MPGEAATPISGDGTKQRVFRMSFPTPPRVSEGTGARFPQDNGPRTEVPEIDLWIGMLHEALAAHGDFTRQFGSRIGNWISGYSGK